MFDMMSREEPGASPHGPAPRAAIHAATPGNPGARPAPSALADLAALVSRGSRVAAAVGECTSWSAGDRGAALRDLDRLAGTLATIRAAILVAERAATTSLRAGDRDFESARARQTRTGFGEARREVRQAETLVALPVLADGVRAGRIPLAHVDALARVTSGVCESTAEALTSPEMQARLAGMAERQSVKEFTAAAARLVASASPADLERGAAAQRRARFFVMSRQPDGTFLRGRLDNVSAEVLRVALASVGQAPDAGRDKPQADADALIALAERATSGMAGVRARRTGSTGAAVADPEQDAADARVSGVANRPTLTLVVPAETFAEIQAAQRGAESGAATAERGAESGAADTPADRPPDAPTCGGAPPATLDDGTPVASSQLARALCDSEIGRLVMSAQGLPLDLGRTQRLYSGAQRRAVIVRDRQCTWNGCDVPAAYCEVHHIRWWDRDRGPTSVENGLLVCSHHHHVIHELGLVVRRLISSPEHGSLGRCAAAGPGGASPPVARDRGAPPPGSTVVGSGAARPETRSGGLSDPVRYVFSHPDGRMANAPPATPGE